MCLQGNLNLRPKWRTKHGGESGGWVQLNYQKIFFEELLEYHFSWYFGISTFPVFHSKISQIFHSIRVAIFNTHA